MKYRTLKTLAAFLVATVALYAFFLTGCSTTPDNGGETSLTKQDVITALEIAAALTIGDDLEKAQRALEIVADARRYIGDGQVASADQVLDYILAQALRSTDLDAGSQIAIRKFIDRYRKNFTLESQQIGLDPQILLTVNEALTALEAVAVEVQTFGAAKPRTYARPVTMAEPLDESLYGYLTSKRTRQAYPLFGSHAAAGIGVQVKGDRTGGTYPAYTDATMPSID